MWGVVGLVLLVTGWGGIAQDGEPRVNYLSPMENDILRNSVEVAVEGQNLDLELSGFADFLFSIDGETFTTIGRDLNAFDGLSIVWDTTTVADGEYTLRTEITDIANTMGIGTLPVLVNNHSNQSFTSRVTQDLANTLGALAGALDFPETLGLEEAISAIQDNLKIAVATVEDAFADIQKISHGVPDAILKLDPFLQHLALITALSDAVIAANDSIEGLVLSEAQAAFLDLSTAIGEFSKLRPNGIDFSPFAGVAQTLKQAASRLDALLAAIQGQSDESTDEVLQEFLDIARDVVPIIVPIAGALAQQVENFPVAFSDVAHPISVQFFENQLPGTLHIGDQNTLGQIELFDANATSILMAPLERGQFNWDGRITNGALAGAGTYYFLATLATDAEPIRMTGRIIVKP